MAIKKVEQQFYFFMYFLPEASGIFNSERYLATVLLDISILIIPL